MYQCSKSQSGSGSVSQRYGSEDPDPHPNPYQNVRVPQHLCQSFSATCSRSSECGRGPCFLRQWSCCRAVTANTARFDSDFENAFKSKEKSFARVFCL